MSRPISQITSPPSFLTFNQSHLIATIIFPAVESVIVGRNDCKLMFFLSDFSSRTKQQKANVKQKYKKMQKQKKKKTKKKKKKEEELLFFTSLCPASQNELCYTLQHFDLRCQSLFISTRKRQNAKRHISTRTCNHSSASQRRILARNAFFFLYQPSH